MALIKTNNLIGSVTGSISGITFKRDRSGLHMIALGRHVKQRTTAQNKQRNAFSIARGFSCVTREVAINIYRALSGLDPQSPPNDYYPDMR